MDTIVKDHIKRSAIGSYGYRSRFFRSEHDFTFVALTNR